MPPGICLLLLLGLLRAARGLITGDEGPPGFSPLKTPVYFPVFPEDFEDFGLRLGEDAASEAKGKSLNMPTTTPKPITTTDKLPINPDGLRSHVALEPVTQPPGPSYLTDSYYYVDDHTPKPNTDAGETHGHDIPDRESEKQGLQDLNEPRSPLALIGVPAVSVSRAPTPPTVETTLAPPKATRRPSHSSRTSRPSRPPHPSRLPKPSPSPAPVPENVNVRPAFTPIATPLPTAAPKPIPLTTVSTPTRSSTRSRTSYTPSTSPTRPPSRSYSSSRSSSRDKGKSLTSGSTTSRRRPKTRVTSRRPHFESARLSAFTDTATTTTTRPTRPPSSAYRTPTPPTRPPTTTTPSRRRGYRGRPRTSSAPQRKRPTERKRPRKQEAPVYHTSTKSYRAPSSLYHVRGTTTTVTAPAQPDFVQSDPNIYVPVEYDDEAIPGVAGIDYPVYATVPDTRFVCDAQEHPGLYADTEAQCQIFHICQEDGRHDSFLCPNGTVFNQQYFVCDWWYNFSCDHATRFYSLNALIYEIPDAEKYSKK